jgi:hypothetical protein
MTSPTGERAAVHFVDGITAFGEAAIGGIEARIA